MAKFRKKPVVIEAVQVSDREAAPAWFGKAVAEGLITPDDRPAGLRIHTLEGVMVASPGDWIIQGVKGEIYPCKPDIFAATYEPAEPAIKLTETASTEHLDNAVVEGVDIPEANEHWFDQAKLKGFSPEDSQTLADYLTRQPANGRPIDAADPNNEGRN